jgi:hypothetical protein
MTSMSNMDHSNGTYVALLLSGRSQQLIDRFSEQVLKLPDRVDPVHLHTTVIYSRTPVRVAEYLNPNIFAMARPLRYEIFPTHEGTPCLVLLLDSIVLRDLNTMLTKLGATSTYEKYNPHLTLSYNYTGTLDNLPLIPYDLEYDALTVEPLDEETIPSSK